MSLYPAAVAASALKVTIASCRSKKQRGEKLCCLTAYDYAFARLFDESGVDLLLVGDSWGMAAAGQDNTLAVTLEEMIIATRAVRRAVRRALVVADMPFGTYQLGPAQAVANAIRLVKEAGAEAVKLEGGAARADVVAAIVAADIPVMGHIGLLPQSVHRQSGYRVQGTTQEAARQLFADARALESAGAFSLVIEGVPREIAAHISRHIAIPTIGIGAGPDCDGQILVMHDLLGLSFGPRPKFVRPFADLATPVRAAVENYRLEVESAAFPADGESYHLPPPDSASAVAAPANSPRIETGVPVSKK